MTVQVTNAELARLLAPKAAVTQPTLQHIINQGATYLNDLQDVIIINATYGQYLRNNTYLGGLTYWMNTDVSQIAIDLLGTGGFTPTDPTLVALAAYNSNGLVTQTAADTFTGRTLTAPAAGITISNPAGIAGNPTFALANDLSALEGLGSTGIAVRSATDTWVQRTITGPAAGITVSNSDGVSGNPTLALANDLSALEALASSGFAVRTGTDTWAIRTLTEGSNIDITNPAGTAGDPTITAVASGSDTQVQFNDGGTNFGADADLIWNKTNNALGIAGISNGNVTLSRTMPGLEFRQPGGSTNARLTEAIKFMSTDPSFTTENPKLLAAIAGRMTEDYIADTDGGMGIDFFVTDDNPGTTNVPVLLVTMRPSAVDIEGKLTVGDDLSTFANPAIHVIQGDVSEEFIRFQGSSANGVLTQSIVEDADVTTATRAGWVKIHIIDDGNQLTDQAYFIPAYTLA